MAFSRAFSQLKSQGFALVSVSRLTGPVSFLPRVPAPSTPNSFLGLFWSCLFLTSSAHLSLMQQDLSQGFGNHRAKTPSLKKVGRRCLWPKQASDTEHGNGWLERKTAAMGVTGL